MQCQYIFDIYFKACEAQAVTPFTPAAERIRFCALKKLAAIWFPIHFIRVHLARLRLRDFRNYPRLDADFSPGFHLLLGDNAQGKTNILEAVYLMATLRSFRGVGGAQVGQWSVTTKHAGAVVTTILDYFNGLGQKHCAIKPLRIGGGCV